MLWGSGGGGLISCVDGIIGVTLEGGGGTTKCILS